MPMRNRAGGCRCCDTSDDPCDFCTETPGFLKVTFSRPPVNGSCDITTGVEGACDELPLNLILPQVNPCGWQWRSCICGLGGTGGFENGATVTVALVDNPAAGLQMVLTLQIGFDTVRYRITFGENPVNCGEQYTLHYDASTSSELGSCTGYDRIKVLVEADPGPANQDNDCPHCEPGTTPEELEFRIIDLGDVNCVCQEMENWHCLRRDVCCRWTGDNTTDDNHPAHIVDCTWTYVARIFWDQAAGAWKFQITINILHQGSWQQIQYEAEIPTGVPVDCDFLPNRLDPVLPNVGFTHCSNFSASYVEIRPRQAAGSSVCDDVPPPLESESSASESSQSQQSSQSSQSASSPSSVSSASSPSSASSQSSVSSASSASSPSSASSSPSSASSESSSPSSASSASSESSSVSSQSSSPSSSSVLCSEICEFEWSNTTMTWTVAVDGCLPCDPGQVCCDENSIPDGTFEGERFCAYCTNDASGTCVEVACP